MSDSERWCKSDRLDGRYSVSTYGRVRNNRTGRIVGAKIGSHGYRVHTIYSNNKATCHLVHRLIARAFIPNPQRFPQVDHINRDRLDNRIRNLRWVDTLRQSINKPVRKDSPFGVAGVTQYKAGPRFQATIKLRGRERYLGSFKTFAEACAARRAAEIVLHQRLFS